MKNMIKKLLCLVVAAAGLSAGAFALDENNIIACFFVEQMTLEEVGAEFQDVDEIKNAFVSGIGSENCVVNKFFPVTSDIADDEDVEMAELVEDYISYNYFLDSNDVYMTVVVRNIVEGEGSDGWVVISHYDGEEYLHFAYYFSISAKKNVKD